MRCAPSVFSLPILQFLTLAWVFTPAAPGQSWAVTDLGELSPNSFATTPWDINAVGQVIGGSPYYDDDYSTVAFVWSHGQIRALAEPEGARYVHARAINNLGEIAGDGRLTLDDYHAYFYSVTEIIDIGLLGTGRRALSLGINDDGYVVGWSNIEDSPFSDSHAFVWSNDSLADLGTLTRIPGRSSAAHDINNEGLIVGASEVSNGFLFACQWRDGVIEQLPVYPGHDWSEARAVNELGQIVGASATEYDAGGIEAVLWSDGDVILLGPLVPDHPNGYHHTSEAFDINDFGEVVGAGQTGFFTGTGFLWSNGERILFPDLLPSGFQWNLAAYAINNAGQMACTGTHYVTSEARAFVLTPPTCRGFVTGDANCDQRVDNFDIDPFVDALTNVDRYAEFNPQCNWLCNLDINRDGLVNNFDIDPFVMLLAGE